MFYESVIHTLCWLAERKSGAIIIADKNRPISAPVQAGIAKRLSACGQSVNVLLVCDLSEDVVRAAGVQFRVVCKNTRAPGRLRSDFMSIVNEIARLGREDVFDCLVRFEDSLIYSID